MSAYSNPVTPVVALVGGPQHRRAYFYRDWLANRLSSRRGRYPLTHACGSSRCYLPSDDTYEHPIAKVTDDYGDKQPALTRVWVWVAPEQWMRWDREYFTPEEAADDTERTAA
ncbi:hypothetical protein ACFOWZ_11545 [Lentzea rhizosphaerae]|uniref:Uncharacterized protein n=1 Tax=Lentzea rhizosphaerae TaxID=2041025 RepID=A0ABV8BS21_9PSEU